MTKDNKKNGDFSITNSKEIPELKCKLTELTHTQTGAQIMHIATDDPENVFCLSFQTIPKTSNGIAHILEHTILCGSQKYPVKDPFFCMRRRSLNTFMNAMTGPDFTCYPAASQERKDFYNLLDVYLDAVFFPLLNVASFHQEGHRLEFIEKNNPESSLCFKGVVFNEMKGNLSNPASRLIETINRALFPDLTYGINSGGDPKEIPNLTYQEFLDFHKYYYHPSRCLFYFYGNLPLEDHLNYLSEKILNKTEKAAPLPPLPCQKRFTEPKKLTSYYPVAKDEDLKDKTWIAFAWLTCDVLQQDELLALHILETILLDTDASPLKQALLKSGHCTQVSSYLESDIKEAPLVILLQGCNGQNTDLLEKVIFETLEKIANEGISQTFIDNALHQLELYRCEITGGHYPFGLSLFLRSGLLKQHGAKADEALVICSIFQKIRDSIAKDPQLFSNLIKKHLLNNKHFVSVTMEPDTTLSQKETADEIEKLKKIKDNLSQEKSQKIISQTQLLEKMQFQIEDLNVLPKISIQDVKKNAKDFSLENKKYENTTIYSHECFTNNIVYADIVMDLPFIAEDELASLRLFFHLLTQMGCGGRSYEQNLDLIQAHTGGIGSAFSLNLQADNHLKFYPYLYIQGKSLNHKVDKLFTLLKDFLTSTDFTDRKRIREVLNKHFTSLNLSINQNPLNYAINLSSSGFDVASKIANECYGLPYFHQIKALTHNFEEKVEYLINKMQEFQKRLLSSKEGHIVITADEEVLRQIEKEKYFGLTEISEQKRPLWKSEFHLTQVLDQGRKISSSVAFTCKTFNTISYTHPDAPAISVASNLFNNLILHRCIREQGGAYGCGALSSPTSGNFYFYSSSDPNVLSTLTAFEESIKIVENGNFTKSDLEEAQLEIIQELDSPVPPGNRGKLAYSWLRRGQDIKKRQAFRDRLLNLTKQEVMSAVDKHVRENWKRAVTVTFADQELLEKENSLMKQSGKKPLELHSI